MTKKTKQITKVTQLHTSNQICEEGIHIFFCRKSELGFKKNKNNKKSYSICVYCINLSFNFAFSSRLCDAGGSCGCGALHRL